MWLWHDESHDDAADADDANAADAAEAWNINFFEFSAQNNSVFLMLFDRIWDFPDVVCCN